MKKVILGLLTAITVASGASLLTAQTLQPCSPIPDGCRVTKPCKCEGNICSDEYECGPIVKPT